jgi:hypothetical protein
MNIEGSGNARTLLWRLVMTRAARAMSSAVRLLGTAGLASAGRGLFVIGASSSSSRTNSAKPHFWVTKSLAWAEITVLQNIASNSPPLVYKKTYHDKKRQKKF